MTNWGLTPRVERGRVRFRQRRVPLEIQILVKEPTRVKLGGLLKLAENSGNKLRLFQGDILHGSKMAVQDGGGLGPANNSLTDDSFLDACTNHARERQRRGVGLGLSFGHI